MFSARPIPEKNIDKVIKLVSNLEDVSDIREIIGLVTAK